MFAYVCACLLLPCVCVCVYTVFIWVVNPPSDSAQSGNIAACVCVFPIGVWGRDYEG